jgi:glycerol kinase
MVTQSHAPKIAGAQRKQRAAIGNKSTTATGTHDDVKHILALDQGTTSSRAIVFAEDGSVRAMAQQEFRQIFPQPGWVEHDPEEIWASQLAVARRALAQAGLKATDIAALGIANQRETSIVWERKSGRPVHNAIVWQDRRTADACAGLTRRGKTNAVRSKTGLVLDPYFSATKLTWLLDTVPGLRLRAERGELAFGTVDSWLAWKLSDGALHVTDVSNASRTMLYNIHAGDWDEALLALFRIPRALLPRVLPSSHPYGESAKKIFGASIPIGGIAGDQQAALFGQACHDPGMAKNTYGTGCFMLLNTGARAVPSAGGLLTTRCAQRGAKPRYALEGSVFIAGAVVQWLRDGLGIIRASNEIEALAASVVDSGGVYLVPAFAGLGAPHWDAYARGTILGLTRGSTQAHIARAALEAIAFQSAEVLQSMQQDAGIALKELRVDGGAAVNDTLMQFQADILGVPVVRPKVLETTALGAAYLAGLAAGVWKDTAAISRQWEVGRRFEPAMRRDQAEARMVGWRRALKRSKRWIEH